MASATAAGQENCGTTADRHLGPLAASVRLSASVGARPPSGRLLQRRRSIGEADMRVAARKSGVGVLIGGLGLSSSITAAARKLRERPRSRRVSQAQELEEEERIEVAYRRTLKDAAAKRRLSRLAVLFVYGAWAVLVWRARNPLSPSLHRRSAALFSGFLKSGEAT